METPGAPHWSSPPPIVTAPELLTLVSLSKQSCQQRGPHVFAVHPTLLPWPGNLPGETHQRWGKLHQGSLPGDHSRLFLLDPVKNEQCFTGQE